VPRVRLAELPALCSRLTPNCATGDGWASRLEDSLLHGTIPVIIQDGVAEKFHGVVDYAAISVRIAEADIERVRVQECRHAR
jgi:Exostosin family